MDDPRRVETIARFLDAVRGWAEAQSDVRAVAVAGSWCRGVARIDSDLDLVVLVDDPERYRHDPTWRKDLELPGKPTLRSWGPLTEYRFVLPGGLEIDFGVAPLSWAGDDPVDPGTRAVVADGIAILHDPDARLARLQRACGLPPRWWPLANG